MTLAELPLAEYLLQRLAQIGIRSVFGVPGDFNLRLLDYIYQTEGLNWGLVAQRHRAGNLTGLVGNANELGAAYAADGYARVRGVPGALITTFGVGEMSALNGVAGAFAEQVPIVHIVGTTALATQRERMAIHHTIDVSSPDHTAFQRMSEPARGTSTFLNDAKIAASEIDRCIAFACIQKRPVYIYVPVDMVAVPLDRSLLATPLNLEPECDQSALCQVVDLIVAALEQASRPVLLVDGICSRYTAINQTKQLAETLKIPLFSTLIGKAIVDESHPMFCGIYNGVCSLPGVKAYVESSDCVIDLGPMITDCNSGGFTRDIPAAAHITIGAFETTVAGKTYLNLPIKKVLESLLKALSTVYIAKVDKPSLALVRQDLKEDDDSKQITQSWIWHKIGDFVKDDDIVVIEAGTAQYGFPDAVLKARQVTIITQFFFASIGYSVGACLGAAIAHRELGRSGRVILLVGDGSIQMTVQEIGTMIRLDLKPIIFVINNSGYTIERAIHGAKQSYNDISEWQYQEMLKFLGARHYHSCSAKDKDALIKILSGARSKDTIQLIEVFMDKFDSPWRLSDAVALVQNLAKRV